MTFDIIGMTRSIVTQNKEDSLVYTHGDLVEEKYMCTL